MPKITFVYKDKEVSGDFDASTTLLEAALKLDVPIVSTCGGQPSCTDCRSKIHSGFEHLNKPEFEEINLMGSVSHITKIRLACQAKATADVRVEPLRLKGEAKRPVKPRQGPLGRKNAGGNGRDLPSKAAPKRNLRSVGSPRAGKERQQEKKQVGDKQANQGNARKQRRRGRRQRNRKQV